MTAIPNYTDLTAASAQPYFYRFHNGQKARLQFGQGEYAARIAGLRAITSVTSTRRVVGLESDHLSLAQHGKLTAFVNPLKTVDLFEGTMRQRMHKSAAEIEMIRAGAAVTDVGGYAIRDAVKEGVREIDVAMAGRDAMELETARRFPDANTATPGSDSSPASTPTARTTRSPAASFSAAISCHSTPSR